MYKKKIDDILTQEISRGEFLKAGGAIILTVIGLPSIVNTVTKAFSGSEKKTTKRVSSTGYGGRPYGR